MVINTHKSIDCKTLPPQNILAEEVLLGHLLTDEVSAQNIIESIKLDFFSLEKHKILYVNIVNVYSKYTAMNITHLIYLLWHRKLLKKIGGLNKITHLIQKAQILVSYSDKGIHVKEYIQIIYQHYIRRIFIQYSYNILQLSYINTISIKQLYEKSTKYLQQVGKLVELQKDQHLHNLISNFLLKLHDKTENNIHQQIFSGFTALDQITSGFKAGDLIVIAGRPSMGKTSFAINITNHIVFKLSLGVYIFSLEMSKNQILDKIISVASKITVKNIHTKKINSYEWEYIQNICKLLIRSTLQIDDEGNASISYIKSKAKLINYITKKKPLLLLTIFN